MKTRTARARCQATQGGSIVWWKWPEQVWSASSEQQGDGASSRWLILYGLLSLVAAAWIVIAVVAARVYGQSEPAVYATVIGGLFVTSMLAHHLNRAGGEARQRGRQFVQLELLARAILAEPPDDIDLPRLLAAYVPALFADAWIEIRLLPDRVLYFQGPGWRPADDEVWQQVAQTAEPYLTVPAVSEAVAQGFALQAWLVPIAAVVGDQILGGVYLIPSQERPEPGWLAAAQSLAIQVALVVYREDAFHKTLAAQAEVYEEEVYAQAYQAEVYAQALAYQRVAQELALAGQIQAGFLPQQVPELNGWQLTVTLEPAKETSGDFYDFIPLPDGRLGIVVADVADKGLGAALYMALSRTLIRVYAVEHESEPDKVLAAANRRILADTNSDLFVTVFYGVLDPQTGTLTYCNAGHNPPLLLSAKGDSVQRLPLTALPLGLFEDEEWEQGMVRMQPGDVLILYTDGLTEAENEFEEYFGEARLQAVAQANLGRPAEVIESKIITAVYDYMGEAAQQDDITLMVVVRNPN